MLEPSEMSSLMLEFRLTLVEIPLGQKFAFFSRQGI